MLATGHDSAGMLARVGKDPLVVFGIGAAEIHAVTPSLMADGMVALLQTSLAVRSAR